MSEIGMDEWKAELDKYRGRPRFTKFTEEQVEFLKYAREESRKVSWAKIEELWARRWPSLKAGFLREHYEKLKQTGEIKGEI